MIAFIGVRISWLMLERKAVFARLIFSASSNAFVSIRLRSSSTTARDAWEDSSMSSALLKISRRVCFKSRYSFRRMGVSRSIVAVSPAFAASSSAFAFSESAIAPIAPDVLFKECTFRAKAS